MPTFRIVNVSDGSREELSPRQYIDAISKNRDRIRSLAGILTQIGGVLISASLVVLFFLIREGEGHALKLPALLQFASSILIALSLILSVLSAYVRDPLPSATYGDKINNELRLFNRERRLVIAASYSLFFCISLFICSLVLFAIDRILS